MRRLLAPLALAAVALAALGWHALTRQVAPPGMVTPPLIEFFGHAAPVPEKNISPGIRVAVASLRSARDKEDNLARIERIARRAHGTDRKLQVVVFGEASLGLYHDAAGGAAYQWELAEPIPGPSSERIGRLAMELGIYIVYGAMERRNGELFNSMVVVDSAGRVVTSHRKMMLHSIDVANRVTEAPLNASIFAIDGVHFGLAICADANSTDLVNAYRQAAIDVLLYSVTSKVPPTAKWLRYWPYAPIYDAWIVAANRVGREGDDDYPGTVFVAAPNGHVQVIGDRDDDYLVTVVGHRR